MGTIEKGHKLNNETRMNTVKPGTNWNIYVTVFFSEMGTIEKGHKLITGRNITKNLTS